MTFTNIHSNRVLIVSVGTSPQIVTEVIYALTVQRIQQNKNPFIPTKIVIVSTQTGVDKARENLDGINGYYQRLLNDYQLENMPEQLEYRLIEYEKGKPLDDIRNSQDNAYAANSIANTIREFTRDEDSALHVSMAGGRKTQGYYTGFALSLFGRQQDRMSHILVSDGYEGHPNFFYPTPSSQMIVRKGQDESEAIDASLGKVELADIPFVLLHDMVPQKFHTEEDLDIAALVEQVRRQQAAVFTNDYLLHIDLPNSRVGILDNYINFESNQLELTYLLMMALAKVDPEQNDEFELPNVNKHKAKEFDQIAHHLAVTFSRSYLIVKGKSHKEAKQLVPDDFFRQDLESDEQQPASEEELIGLTHNKKKITESLLGKLSQTDKNNLIEKHKSKILEKRFKINIDHIIEEEWGISDISSTESRFITSFFEGNKGCSDNYMSQRGSTLKKLMAEEFIEPILQQVIPSSGFNESGKEQRDGKKSLLIDTNRIKITFHD